MSKWVSIGILALDVIEAFAQKPKRHLAERIAWLVVAGILFATGFSFGLAAAYLGMRIVLPPAIACLLTGLAAAAGGAAALLISRSFKSGGNSGR